MFTDVYYNNL